MTDVREMNESVRNLAPPAGDSEAAALRDLVRRALRRAIAAELADRPADARLGLALREACERARQNRLRAEQLLVLLKEAWRQLPETRQLRSDGHEALARIVTACIGEYYRTGVADG